MKTASPDLNSYAQDINHIVPVIVLSSERKKGQREFDSSVVYNDNPYIYICVPINYVIKSLFS